MICNINAIALQSAVALYATTISAAYNIIDKVLVSFCSCDVFVICSEQVMLVHALSCSSSILLEDLKMLGQSINKPIDLDDIASRELFASTQGPDQEITDAEVSGQISRKIRNFSEVFFSD